ncbi:MAG: hypothetical protein N3G21_05480 [Candidatus Hydrogenedentes bacterium]|nr:hypothetical protein [Candidatus Hydrogenedentota bacterium]
MLNLNKTTMVVNLSVLLLVLLSIFSVFFPYQIQSYLFDRINIFSNLSNNPIRIIKSNYPNEKNIYDTLAEALKKNSIPVREVPCEKDALTYHTLLKDKGDLTIVPSFISLMHINRISPIALTTPSHLIILSPKSYQISEFAQLTGKKVGIKDKNEVGLILFQYLTKIYLFDIPPTLIQEPIRDIEKSFRDGIVECVIWIADIHSPEVLKEIKEGDYNLVEISLADTLTKMLPGLHIQSINLSQIGQNKTLTLEIDNVLAVSKKVSNHTIRRVINTISKPEIYAKINSSKPFPSLPPYLPIHPEIENFLKSGKQISSLQLRTLIISFIFIIVLSNSIRYLVKQWKSRKDKKSNEELEKTLQDLKKIDANLTINTPYEEQLNYIKIIKSQLSWGIQNYNHNKISAYQLIILLHRILQTTLTFTEKTIESNLKKTYLEKIESKATQLPTSTNTKGKSELIQENSSENIQPLLFEVEDIKEKK